MFLGKKADAGQMTDAAYVERVDTDSVSLSQLESVVAQLVAGNTQAVLGNSDPVSVALRPLAEELNGIVLARLKALVQIWVQQTEPVLAIAEMMSDMRDLQTRNEAMATASEQMSASINEVARSASNVSQDSQVVKDEMAQNTKTVREAVTTMDGITEAFSSLTEKVHTLDKASDQIAAILKTIEQIAGQTNLLALNATIEAARAGEAGKGFAVVASEVKTLAKQTSVATEDIRQRITTLQDGMNDMLLSMSQGSGHVSHGASTIKEVGDEMTSVGQRMDSVASEMLDVSSTVEEQTKVTGEVAANIAAVVPMANHMLTSIDQLAATVEKSGTTIQGMLQELLTNPDSATIVLVAKSDHASFKKRIIDVLVGRGQTKGREIPDHHLCRLGKWYDSVTDERIRSLDVFKNLMGPHQRVHAYGRQALEAYERSDMSEALSQAKLMDQASTEVIEALDTLYEKIVEAAYS